MCIMVCLCVWCVCVCMVYTYMVCVCVCMVCMYMVCVWVYGVWCVLIYVCWGLPFVVQAEGVWHLVKGTFGTSSLGKGCSLQLWKSPWLLPCPWCSPSYSHLLRAKVKAKCLSSCTGCPGSAITTPRTLLSPASSPLGFTFWNFPQDEEGHCSRWSSHTQPQQTRAKQNSHSC